MSTFYMSFCDPDKPEGTQFLGAPGCWEAGARSWKAVTMSHLEGVNPGGEIQSWEIPDEWRIHPDYVGRLLTKEEAESMPEPIPADGRGSTP